MKISCSIIFLWQILELLTAGNIEAADSNELVAINSQDLELILESGIIPKSDDSNVPELLYTRFNLFLVLFDEDCTQGTSDFTCISSVLNRVNDYSSKLSNDSSSYLDIWLAIIPDGNVQDLVERVLAVLLSARDEYNSTIVSGLVLNYRATVLNSDSVSLFKQDIGITKYLMDSHSLDDIQFGIILEPSNCRERQHHIHALDLEQNDHLIFIHSGVSMEKSNLYNVLNSACLFLQVLNITKATPSMETYFDVLVDLSTSTFSFEKDILEVFRKEVDAFNEANKGKYEITGKVVMQAVISATNSTSNQQRSIKPAESTRFDENWLYAPAFFNLKHLGVSFEASDYIADELYHFSLALFSKFRQVILETQVPSGNTTLRIGAGIGAFQDFLLHQEQLMNLTRFSKVKMPVDMMLDVGMYSQTLDENVEAMKQALVDGAIVNREFPGVISHVLISWTNCFEKEYVCSNDTGKFEAGSDEKTQIFIAKLESLILILSDALLIREKMITQQVQRVPKLGIVWDLKFCWEMKLMTEKIDIFLAQKFADLDLAILKMSVSKDDIVSTGAESLAWILIQNAFICEIYMEGLHPSKPGSQNGITTRPWHIHVTGCRGDDNPKEIAEVAKFWEVFNDWAEMRNRIVYIKGAFKFRSASPAKFCDAYTTLNECSSCGWWNVRTNQTSNGSQIIFEDVKTEALRLMMEEMETKSIHEQDQSTLVTYYVVFVCVAAVVVAVLLPFLVTIYRSNLQSLSRAEVDEFFKGVKKRKSHSKEIPEENAESFPYNKKIYELSPSQFTIDEKAWLGNGEFGVVYRGTIRRKRVEEQVAVKTVSSSASKADFEHSLTLRSLLSEIKILQYVGLHKNIVAMKAAYTAKLQYGQVNIFLEICELGSLENYLKTPSLRKQFSNELLTDLTKWGLEIATGMEFLALKKVVHADLATRNVLLTATRNAKICDFGMSRRLFNYTEYLKSSPAPLPWRWMAPESLRIGLFNEKTDVWAFGVTLWEVFTLGEVPFGGLSWSDSVLKMLESGSRLEKPKLCSDKMFGMMSDCWRLDAVTRPTFSDLTAMLTAILKS